MNLSCTEMMLGDRSLADKFHLAKAAGFDGIDLRGDRVGPRIAETHALIRDTGLTVPTVYGRLTSPLLARTLGERADAIAVLRRRLADAAAVGATRLIVVPIFGAPRLVVDRGGGVGEIELALLMVLLDELREEAQSRGVSLVLEPLNRRETHLLHSPTATAELTRRLGSPWVGTMVDTYHMDLEGQDAVREAEAIADQMQLVHLSDRDRTLPGAGGIDFAPLLRKLASLGYTGFLGFECNGPFELQELRASVEWVRGRVDASGLPRY